MKDRVGLVRAEIKRLRKEVKDNIAELGNSESERIGLFKDLEIYDNILSFIDSMQEEPKSKFEQSIQEGDNIVYNEDLGCRVNLSQLKRVAKKDPRYCMYSTANYTNADRLTLCKDCKELCRYNQKTAAESLCISQEAYDEIVDKCLYGSDVELVDDADLPKEEPVSEDFEKEVEKMWAQEAKFRDTDYTIAELTKQDYEDCAHHFANWQKQQLIKQSLEAVREEFPDGTFTYSTKNLIDDDMEKRGFCLFDYLNVRIVLIQSV